MTGSCDRLWEIDAYRAGQLVPRDAESFERHVRVCAACRARLEGDERLHELTAASLPAEPSELGLRRLRARVLRDVAGGQTPRRSIRRERVSACYLHAGQQLSSWRVLAAGAFAIALVLAGWSLRSHPTGVRAPTAATSAPSLAQVPAEAFAGAVAPAPGARWSQAREALVERVELADGRIRVKVRPQSRGERFLVGLPDGEIEVRGTEFDVDVERGATGLVRVLEGVVELRLDGRPVMRLGPSESWAAEPPEGSAAPEVLASRPVASAAGAPRAAAPVASAKAGDEAAAKYADAVQRLRDGRYDDAASRFHALFLADPGSPQAEDASFLEAVALARAGRTDAAALAGEHHLASFPRSFHAREAAILVARAASQRHDCEKARQVVAPWSGATPVPPDVTSALAPCAPATVP